MGRLPEPSLAQAGAWLHLGPQEGALTAPSLPGLPSPGTLKISLSHKDGTRACVE